MAAKTAGLKMTASVAKFHSIGGKTRNRRRRHISVREQIAETITYAATLPGYFTPEQHADMRVAYTAINGYKNHILGGRVNTIVCWYVREGLTPYQFLKLIGRMVDAGVANAYEAELFFNSLRDEANAAYAAKY